MTLAAEVAIIGGGPAGISCALWLRQYGIDALLIERGERLGGALLISHYPNHWVPGQENCNGPELARRFETHIAHSGVRVQTGTDITGITRSGNGFLLTSAREKIEARALVAAPGMAYRGREALAGIAGAEEACRAGSLTFGQASPDQLKQLKGADIIVIGGGDNAYETAIAFAEQGGKAHVLVRGHKLRAQARLRDKLSRLQNIELHFNAPLQHITVAGDGLTVKAGNKDLHCRHIFALLGYTPQTAWIAGQFPDLHRDESGFIAVDAWVHASVPSLYAAGDAVTPQHPCVLSAMDSGSLAARSIQRDFDR